tara:strand:- start:354 stop:710 length:357 start_codon:yes stop_codon:yes gene_type:complete
MKQYTEVKMPNNIAQLPKKAEENKVKQLWEKSFHRIPEVLTLADVATYLRVSESNVKLLVKEGQIKTLPGLEEDRVFKGFLLSYLTQSEPEAMGLIAKNLDGVQAPGIRGSHEPAIGF